MRMKGRNVGRAEVSHEHGNFIVNRGKADAHDVLRLIDEIRAEAREQRGIDLETEIQVVGEDQPDF